MVRLDCTWSSPANPGRKYASTLRRNKMTSDFDQVGYLYRHFGLPAAGPESVPHLLDDKTENFRIKCLHEELMELQRAMVDNDIVEISDALVDLVVFAEGTAHMMGLPWQELFNEIQKTNMAKVRATSPEQSKRNSGLDLIKPTGWKHPDLRRILIDAGWDLNKEEEE